MKKRYDEIVVASDLNNLVLVNNFVEQICDQYNIPNHFGILSVALEQAVTNAIVHGNKSEPSKDVSIRCSKKEGGICITVADKGNGFDFAKYMNLYENECNGILMMQTLSNQIEFKNSGNTVALTFFIEGIETTTAVERSALMENYFQSVYNSIQPEQKTIVQKKKSS